MMWIGQIGRQGTPHIGVDLPREFPVQENLADPSSLNFATVGIRASPEGHGRLEDPSQDGCTLLALALDAGFSSKSTFNSIFKKLAGTTPSAWRKQRGAS